LFWKNLKGKNEMDENTNVEPVVTDQAQVNDTPTTAVEPAPPSGSVRESINAAVAKVKERNTATPAAASAPAAPPSAETPPVVAAAPDKARDEQGRFKKLPRSWKPALSQKYEALDPEIQEQVYKREEDVFKGIEQYKGKAQVAQEFEAAVQPYMATIQSLGISPIKAVSELMATDHRLRYGTQQEKAAVIHQLAQNYGVQLGQMESPEQGDPVVGQLQSELAAMKQQLMSFKQAQEQASLNPYINEVNRFRSDPANEHFDQLENHILALIQTGAAKDLADGYQQALWAHPELRQIALAKQQAEKAAEEARRVQAAKAAAVQVRGGPAIATPQNINPSDRRAVIKAAIAGVQR